MRVLQINANYGFGSTGLIVKEISEMLEKEGHESFYAYQKSTIQDDSGYQVGNSVDWKVHAALCRVLGRQGYYSSRATKRLIDHINEIKPDIVHLHNLHSNYVNIDILFSYLAEQNIATVITMHDCWFFTGKCFHYVDCNCDRFIDSCGECPKKKAPPRSVAFDWSSWSLKNKQGLLLSIPRLKVIGCSEWICNEAKKSFLKDSDISCIYNGVDTSVFCPTERLARIQYKIKDNEFLIMGMANKWLQDANIGVIEKVLEISGTRLMIVGCTDSQINYLRKYGNKLITIGFIRDRLQLADFYSSADLFINLTHADTLPTVNMESICCGTPVLTYDSCGSPELVNDKTGFIVNEGNQEELIMRIIDAKYLKFDKCREEGIRRFDKSQNYKQYLDVYSRILQC